MKNYAKMIVKPKRSGHFHIDSIIGHLIIFRISQIGVS